MAVEAATSSGAVDATGPNLRDYLGRAFALQHALNVFGGDIKTAAMRAQSKPESGIIIAQAPDDIAANANGGAEFDGRD
jgi:hypothetical protein